MQSDTCGEVNCTRNFLDIAYIENETATKVGLQKQNFESKEPTTSNQNVPQLQDLILEKIVK